MRKPTRVPLTASSAGAWPLLREPELPQQGLNRTTDETGQDNDDKLSVNYHGLSPGTQESLKDARAGRAVFIQYPITRVLPML